MNQCGRVRRFLLNCVSYFLVVGAIGQCPPNIGFEEGSFRQWNCYTGWIDTTGAGNVVPQPPTDGRHMLLKKSNNAAVDFYGHFPVNCPNGSGYSVKIGNDNVGAEAEGVSYTYTIPAGQDLFSLVYNYAVVFQDPGHSPHEQPRFTAKVYDVTGGKYISCSSFDFAASGDLPGFMNGTGDVLYKPWSPVTIKLAGYGGKTIRLEFTTNDCTRGGHFGYAYLDIDENCTAPIQGNVVCLNAGSVNLVGPFGYKEYSWHDSSFNTTFGNTNSLTISPAPAPGTKYALRVVPYPGSGCIDTLYTTITAAGVRLDFILKPSVEACMPGTINLQDPTLREGSSSGLAYSYFVDSGLSSYLPNASAISKTGVYYIKAVNDYGCYESRSIKAILRSPPAFNLVSSVKGYWPNTIDITNKSLLGGNLQGLSFSYWKDPSATIGLHNAATIAVSGTYFVKATDSFGCTSVKAIAVSITPPPPPNVFSPNNDGINDYWQVTGLQAYPGCRVTVYNRWGQPMFHSAGYHKPWDGTRYGDPLPVDTYYYVIEYSPDAGSIKGTVTIIR